LIVDLEQNEHNNLQVAEIALIFACENKRKEVDISYLKK
jgi:hypothetical protein